MNKIIYVLYVAAAFLFAACESSVSSESEDGEISICMTLPPELSVNTRSGSIGGVTIDNVWVVQFLPDGSKLHAVHYDESKISDLGSSGALIQVATGGFSNVESTFRVIANFGASQAELVAFSKKEGAKSDDLKRIVVAASSSRCPWCRTARASGAPAPTLGCRTHIPHRWGGAFPAPYPARRSGQTAVRPHGRSIPAQSAAQGPVHQNIWQSRRCHRLPPAHSNPFAAANCAVRSLPVPGMQNSCHSHFCSHGLCRVIAPHHGAECRSDSPVVCNIPRSSAQR